MLKKKLLITALVLTILAMLIIPQLASVEAVRTTHRYDMNPGVAGEDNSITFTVRNDETQQIFVKSATVNWEWRDASYSWSGSRAIASGESADIIVNFDVPENTPTTTQLGSVVYTYSVGTSSAPTQTLSQSLTDFSVKPETDIWFYLTIIIIIAASIIVVSVVYLYVKKKPQVHIFKETKQMKAEKEEPKTRIRAPTQRGGNEAVTQIVSGAGAATMVTTPGGGLEVVFPKGIKKIVTNEMVIGRRDFGNVLDASLLPRLSKNHLRIYKQGKDFYVEDGYRGAASTNGTKLNGMEIRGAGPQQITTASTLSLGDVTDIQLSIK